MERSICIFNIKISCVDTCIEIDGISLDSENGTGIESILSSFGAEKVPMMIQVKSINFIMIRNLLLSLINNILSLRIDKIIRPNNNTNDKNHIII